MFRTPSGQTGTDAYTYELAAIANARRALDARMSRLIDAMISELPDSATCQWPLPSEMFPDFTVSTDAAGIRAILDLARLADEFGFENVTTVLRTLQS